MGRIADMQKLEKEKQKQKKRIILLVFVVIGVAIAIAINLIAGIVIALIPLVINAIVDASKDIARGEEDLTKKIKEEIAPKTIEATLPNSEYFPYEGISIDEYKQAEYTEPVFEYKSSDKILTNVNIDNETNFQIEYAEVEYKTEAKTKDRFVGIFGHLKLSKDIRSKIKINHEGMYEYGNVFKIEIDSKEFEDNFDVMSPNKVLAKKVLTDDIIKEIVKLFNIYGYMLEINIIRDKLYVRVASGSMIKDTKDGKIIDRIVLDKHYNLLKPLTNLIEKIYTTIDEINI